MHSRYYVALIYLYEIESYVIYPDSSLGVLDLFLSNALCGCLMKAAKQPTFEGHGLKRQ